ncbi:hypothetical protein BC834DRAFT_662737 [Gloeopeniophorella convolvens]|nr:hypothetical protein BC834DRAFT_662737 [Gloeopeniophorella convolvens]
MDPGDSDRLFTFVVSKTHEQEESAVTRSGFQIHSPHISTSDPVTDDHGTDVEIPKPRLLSGETTQGFLTATYVQRTILSEPLDRRTYNHLGLLQLVTDNALVLSEDLDENAIGALMNVSLAKAFPNQHRKWRSEGQRIEDKFKREHDERQEAVLQDLERSLASLQDTIRVNFAENVANLFPSLDPGSLRSGSTPESLDRDQRVHASTQLAQLEQLYPDFTNIYRKSSEQAKFGTIKAHDYQFLKERLIFAHHLLQKHPGLRAEQQAELIEALLSEGDLKYAKQVLPKSKDKKSQTVWSRAFKIVFSGPDDDEEESFKNEMKDVATHIRDSDFLTGLKDEDHQGLQPAIHEVEALAHSYLSSLIESTAHKTAHSVLRMQQNHCRIMLQRETEAGKGKALKEALLQLIRELNEEFASQSKP